MLSSGWVTRYREMYPTIPIFYFSLKKGMWHAEPTLPLIGLPWQHSNASQSGWVFVPRKAVLIWHKHIMDNAPAIPIVSTSPTTAIFEHVHFGYRCIYRHNLSVSASEVPVMSAFVFFCMNHHLELAVSDAVDEVQSINHFILLCGGLMTFETPWKCCRRSNRKWLREANL